MTADLLPLDEHRARQLTDRIRQAADDLWSLLLEAHEGRAWAALGYDTWEAYVRTEFDMSDRNARYLLNQGRVIREIGSVTNGSALPPISARDARDLKPHLEVVKDAIRQAVEDVPGERVAEIVAEVVERERSRIIQQREDRAALKDWAAAADPGPDFDWERDRELLREGGAIRRVATEISQFRLPSAFVADHMPEIDPPLLALVVQARDWLHGFLAAWEASCPTP